jgi:asparagine synthetase A
MANTARKHDPSENRKITVVLPARLIEGAMRMSGKGLTETIHDALKWHKHHLACQGLLKAKGTWTSSLDFNALRDDED